MLKKLREFNNKNKAIYFFITMIILVFFLAYNNIFKGDVSKKCTAPDYKVSALTMYEYEIKITKPDEVVYISAKRYNNKIAFDKTEKGIPTSYYMYYSNVYMKDVTGVYNIYPGGQFVSGVDNKLLYIEYLDELSADSVIDDKGETVCYVNDKHGVKICVNETQESLEAETNGIKLQYKFSNAGNVKDFDIEVSN